ncbi:hypothetical protein TTHERM_00773400 (macronuclear) [Tetrahymena thermophila SB210]|uniref:Uncharacterized protein n=1 Tax=Tetrahymena thermophila (strain SB210) TaxID=312017 RepID=I7MCH0_TETTS|nr:hypothetical protein TTHERM_00773400 [Tetrahymena thermophila SB210]EAR83930.2 hypothetical protein TTHERM_00773400 [Tetrahymena thermophila SB210]|eukprot:XP_001031593.2 hypothetical protein TTHERM_00773400 [Tetrahymena thermophila SB210]
MHQSMVRKELYEDDYLFNEQEFKEFSIVRSDPYWKIRGTAYALSLNIFGTKEQITKRIQNLLFQNYLHKKPESKSLQEVRETDIEIIVRNLKCSSNQYDNITNKDLVIGDINIEEKIFQHQYPWQVVPELARINKKAIYPDVFKGMALMMRSCMVFYDHFKDDEALTAIVAIPYTPQVLEILNPAQIVALCRALNMRTQYEGIKNFVDVAKQKLLDIYYSVDDINRLHGITPCQSIRECSKIASMYCANSCCKLCCQELQNKNPCIIHDTFDQFLRYKMKQLYNFEERLDFEKNKTLRIYFRKSPRKHDVEQTFQHENVNWGEMKLYYHYCAQKIQYVYLVFNSAEHAQRVYAERHVYELKLEKYDCQIQALSSSLWKKVEKYSDPDAVIAIIKPLSTLDLVTDLPTGQEYISLIHQLIQTITQLPLGDYQIEEDINPISETKDHQHIFVILPNKEYVDRVYNAQPFMGCLIAHKISHIQLLPFKRYQHNICLMCTSKREHNCLHDLCKNCCSRQQYGMLRCPCSYSAISEIEAKKEELYQKDKTIIKENICDKCLSAKDAECSNGLCLQCCRVQAVKTNCPLHDISNYSRKILSSKKDNPLQFSRKMLTFVSEAQIQVRNAMVNGDYDWFRPIYNTHVMQGMIKANRDLQEVKDSGSIIRGLNTNKNKKDGKIFTYQANEPVEIWVNPDLKVAEDINKKGLPYVEYAYTPESCNTKSSTYIKNGINKYRTYSAEEYQQHMTSPSLASFMSFGYHLLFIGLDRKNFSVKDLIQEIQQKLSMQVGKITDQSILVIDNETILTDVFTQSIFITSKNLDQNMIDIGRVACIRFENIYDALAVLCKENIKISLPLANNQNGEPIIYPSAGMIKFLSEFNFNNFVYDQNQQQLVSNAGVAFKTKNKEIQDLNNQIQNLIKYTQQASNKQQKGNKRFNNKKGGGPQPGKKFKKN